jgi:FMN phosphatase YigB (HAD superfamily)
MNKNKHKYKYIFFDWGGVLGTNKFEFVNSNSLRYDLLTPNLHKILDILQHRQYKFGIISNTEEKRKYFIDALKKHNLYHYFSIIVLSSDTDMCKKSCKKIFLQALGDIDPKECLFVGNSIEKDMFGANKVGLNTALVVNKYKIDVINAYYQNITINHYLHHGILDLITIYT